METTFKPYPCCKGLHAAIDGVLQLRMEHAIDPAQVAEVIVGAYEKLVRMHDIYEPATAMAAQFSIPYVVATALMRGVPDVAAFSDKSIREKKVLALARKVRLVVDRGVARHFPAHEPSKVTIRLKNGKSYSRLVICSKGTPENPMSKKEIEEKFTAFASMVIPEKRVARVVKRIWALDRVKSMRKLASLLRAGG